MRNRQDLIEMMAVSAYCRSAAFTPERFYGEHPAIRDQYWAMARRLIDAIERNGGIVVPNVMTDAMNDAVRARVEGEAADGTIAVWPEALKVSPFGRESGT